MTKHEYYKIALNLIPSDVINNYNLTEKKINRFIYARVKRGVYGLVHVGIIAHMALKENLRSFIYEPAPTTPGFWRHNKNEITFTLVVDDFRIRYQRKEGILHLINELKKKIEVI